MKRFAFVAAVTLFACTPTLAPAQEAGRCGPREMGVEVLKQNFHEEKVAQGLTEEGLMLEVFASKDGSTFTVFLSLPNGISCVVSTGQEWMQIQPVGQGA